MPRCNRTSPAHRSSTTVIPRWSPPQAMPRRSVCCARCSRSSTATGAASASSRIRPLHCAGDIVASARIHISRSARSRAAARARCLRAATAPKWCWAASIPTPAASTAGGARPYGFRLAQRFALAGWVVYRRGTVSVHAQGEDGALDAFQQALLDEAPAPAQPLLQNICDAPLMDLTDFRIRASEAQDVADVHVPPDLAPCADCLS